MTGPLTFSSLSDDWKRAKAEIEGSRGHRMGECAKADVALGSYQVRY